MLRIGKLTDYAMLILSQMAKDPHSILSATFLAEALHLSVPTVSKILKMLSDASLLTPFAVLRAVIVLRGRDR